MDEMDDVSLDFFKEIAENGTQGISIVDHLNWQEPVVQVDNNLSFDTFSSLDSSLLPLTPPGSDPNTPTSIFDRNFDVTMADSGQTCLTDAPELERYLRRTNPLQSKDIKRKVSTESEREDVKPMRLKSISQSDSGECPQAQNKRAIRWTKCDTEEWHKIYESSVQSEEPCLHITCDKGLSFSPAESVFICQKKNHFQISLNLEMVFGNATLVEVDGAFERVNFCKIHLYALKAESPQKKVNIEQSSADRSKRPYVPVRIPNGSSTKTLTIGRLHFCETTSNNMRKQGKLNPDQRYFQLVVDIRAYTNEGNYSICRQVSERVIVRASNPGQFENDVALWCKDKSGDCVYRMGHVGINTDEPDQPLTVNGNIKLTGVWLTPSDVRLTEGILQADTRKNLDNINSMKLYRYRYNKMFLQHAGLASEKTDEHLGVLGSDLRAMIPDAVTESTDIPLRDGNVLKDIPMINKDRLLMESIGSIQELSKIAKVLTTRLVELETKNEILEVILKNMVSESMETT
ncbi:myelin regulatory factor-like [Xenia sp. Carnegie-2017]|uniref:myelin regulatory factor-like n=1 Tax=Xenia sp. Carnegie-2017 TaxID=2897299 RepID=UPI001F036250|nr:myelin regulatory factor-like [Xenia sp. Carnegie-2017]